MAFVRIRERRSELPGEVGDRPGAQRAPRLRREGRPGRTAQGREHDGDGETNVNGPRKNST